MKEIVGTEPDFFDLSDERIATPPRPSHLEHHGRMIKATEALKRLDALRAKAGWKRE